MRSDVTTMPLTRLLVILTLRAWISKVSQLIVFESTTVLSARIVHGPLYVDSFVPAGTPVLLALGQPPACAFAPADAEALADAEADALADPDGPASSAKPDASAAALPSRPSGEEPDESLTREYATAAEPITSTAIAPRPTGVAC